MAKAMIQIKASELFNSVGLLKVIAANEKALPAPRKTERQGEYVEILVGIGNNETASITMTREAHDLLLSDDFLTGSNDA
jgi:hypothetical protein